MQSFRRQIDTAADLAGVVRAMKALAASSIGQYERAVESLDDYYRTVELGLSVCLRQAGPAVHSTGKRFEDRAPVGAVVFGSDQGLVGRFNEVVVDFAANNLKKMAGPKRRIWAVGERAQALLTDTGLAPVTLLSVPNSVDSITPFVGETVIQIQAAREQSDVVEVYLFHNHPKSGAGYEPVCKHLLPLDRTWQKKTAALPWPTKNLPQVIEGPTPALDGFIRGYLFVLLFQACAESLNSENASRLAAMQRAEKNIKDILEDLNRKYNSVRQESIDEELFDVVSGFEALTGKRKQQSGRT
jgi:F-type H+-transporting ATPase subunit gamma